jgi:co-chaperonin GroES (HSP10)
MEVKKLLGDRVLVQVEQPVINTSLLMPDQVKSALIPTTGRVIAVGQGFLDIEMQVQVGDRVVFGKSSGYEDEALFGKGNFVMKQADILGVIEEDANVTLK